MNVFSQLGTKNLLWQRVQRHAAMATLFGQKSAVQAMEHQTVSATPAPLIQAPTAPSMADQSESSVFDWLPEQKQPASPVTSEIQSVSSQFPMAAKTILPGAEAAHLPLPAVNQPLPPTMPTISRAAQPASPAVQPAVSLGLTQPAKSPMPQPAAPTVSNEDDQNWRRLQTIIQRQRAKKGSETSEMANPPSVSQDNQDAPIVQESAFPPSPSQPNRASVSPTTQPSTPRLPQAEHSLPAAQSEEDRNWRRLQTIIQRQRIKQATESGEPEILKTEAAPVGQAPHAVSRTTVSPHIEQSDTPTSVPTSLSNPQPSGKAPTSSPAHVTPPEHLDAQPTATPSLEEIWPVQRLSNGEVPKASQPASEASTRATPAADRQPSALVETAVQIKQTLSQISPQQESDSSVQLIMPTRPRPQLAQRSPQPAPKEVPTPAPPATDIPQPPQISEILASQSPNQITPTASSQPATKAQPTLSTQSIQQQTAQAISQHPMPLVQTEVGSLPADLWTQLGKQPPTLLQTPSTVMRKIPSPQETAVTALSPSAEPTAVFPPPTLNEPAIPATKMSQRTIPAVQEQTVHEVTSDSPALPSASSQPATIQLAAAAPVAEATPPRGTEAETELEEQETPEETADFDIDALSRQVYQQLKRRLAVEWERNRGR